MRREARSFGEKVHDGPDSMDVLVWSPVDCFLLLFFCGFACNKVLPPAPPGGANRLHVKEKKTWSRSLSELLDSNYGNSHTKNITLTLQTLNEIIQLKQTLDD